MKLPKYSSYCYQHYHPNLLVFVHHARSGWQGDRFGTYSHLLRGRAVCDFRSASCLPDTASTAGNADKKYVWVMEVSMYFNYSLLDLMQRCYFSIAWKGRQLRRLLHTYSGHDVCSDSCFLTQVRSLQRRKRLLLLLLLRYGHL